jgi:N-acetylmuramoyl-L-alanine amidase
MQKKFKSIINLVKPICLPGNYFVSLNRIKARTARFLPIMLIGGGVFMASCAPNPYASTNKSHKKQVKAYARSLRKVPLRLSEEDSLLKGDFWVGTTNFNLRNPNYVVIHHTAQHSTEQALNTFTLARTKVSAHYVIGREGKVYHMLNNNLRAWHGGISKWGNTTDLNSASIGIELDNNGSEPFAEAQINSLLKVLAMLKKTYEIPTANFIGHADIAPTRKVDPSPAFPWKRLAEQGFGLWYEEDFLEKEVRARQAAIIGGAASLPFLLTLDSAAIRNQLKFLEDNLEVDPDILCDKILDELDPRLALRIIGYDTRNLPAAIRVFKLHYIQENIHADLSKADKVVLYNLYRQCW